MSFACVNSLARKQIVKTFAGDIINQMYSIEKKYNWIHITHTHTHQISQPFVPWDPHLNKPTLLGAMLLQGPIMTLLTHWGRVMHICISKLAIIGSDNGLLPGRRQAIIWTNAGILLIWTLGTNFSEILIEIHIFSFKKMHLKMLSVKWRPFDDFVSASMC